jgi:hypothetical protein
MLCHRHSLCVLRALHSRCCIGPPPHSADRPQYIPETKGLSLEQIDILFRNSSVLKSAVYRREIMENDLHDDEIVNHDAKNSKAGHLEQAKVPGSDSQMELQA